MPELAAAFGDIGGLGADFAGFGGDIGGFGDAFGGEVSGFGGGLGSDISGFGGDISALGGADVPPGTFTPPDTLGGGLDTGLGGGGFADFAGGQPPPSGFDAAEAASALEAGQPGLNPQFAGELATQGLAEPGFASDAFIGQSVGPGTLSAAENSIQSQIAGFPGGVDLNSFTPPGFTIQDVLAGDVLNTQVGASTIPGLATEPGLFAQNGPFLTPSAFNAEFAQLEALPTELASAGEAANIGAGLESFPGIAISSPDLTSGLASGLGSVFDTPAEIASAAEGFGPLPSNVFNDAAAGGLGPSGSLAGATPTASSIGVAPEGGFVSPATALSASGTGTISDVAAGDLGLTETSPGAQTTVSGASSFSPAQAAAAPVTNPALTGDTPLGESPFQSTGPFTGEGPVVQQPSGLGANSLNFGQGGLNAGPVDAVQGEGSALLPGTTPTPLGEVPFGTADPTSLLSDSTGGGGFDLGSGAGPGFGVDTNLDQTVTEDTGNTARSFSTPALGQAAASLPDVQGITVDSGGLDLGSSANQGSFFDVPAGTSTSPLNTDFGSIPQSLGQDAFTPNPAAITNAAGPTIEFGDTPFTDAGVGIQSPDIMTEGAANFNSPFSGQTLFASGGDITGAGLDPSVPGGFSSDLVASNLGATPDLFSDIETGPQLQPGGAYPGFDVLSTDYTANTPLPGSLETGGTLTTIPQTAAAPEIPPFQTTTTAAGPANLSAPGMPTTPAPASGGLPPPAAGAAAASPLSNLFKGLNLGQVAGLGAAGFLLANQPKVPAATNAAIANAGPLAALGEQNIAVTAPTAIQQQVLDKIQQDAINQARQMYFQQGRDPNVDSSYIQVAQNIALQNAALAAGFVQQANQLGVQELQGANATLAAAGAQQLQVQQNFNNSLILVATALGRLFGGSAASGAGAAAAAA